MSRGRKRKQSNRVESKRNRRIQLVLLGAFAIAVTALTVTALGTGQTPAGLASTYVAHPIEDTPQVAPTTVTFLGDSYTEGAGSSKDRTHRWSTTASRSLGWSQTIIAIGGTGYVSGDNYVNQIERVVATGSDVVVISGGRNDVDEPIETVKANVLQVIQGITSGLPDAQVIVISPWWDDDEAPTSLGDVAAAVADTAASVGVEFIDSGQPLAGHPELMSGDGIHPNDAGYAAIAAAVTPLLEAVRSTP